MLMQCFPVHRILKTSLTIAFLAFCLSSSAASKDDEDLLLLDDDPPASTHSNSNKGGDLLLPATPPANGIKKTRKASQQDDDLLLDDSPATSSASHEMKNSVSHKASGVPAKDTPMVRKVGEGDDLLLDDLPMTDNAHQDTSAAKMKKSMTQKANSPPRKNAPMHSKATNQTVQGDDLLFDEPENDNRDKAKQPSLKEDPQVVALKAHEALFSENRYPSATTCATCHEKQFRQWSVSPHAYAQMSPVFNAMQQTINAVANGTNGDFCIRCHDPVGINLGESPHITNAERHPTSREGITCIACHRVNKAYGKISGRLAIVEGDIFKPVYGPRGNEELQRVLDNRDQYRVVTDPNERGRRIHTKAGKFFELTTPGFCGQCHDVNLYNGFRLEEAFSEYKHSPAPKDGVTCQDCHMGKIPGINSGYEEGPAAVVGGIPTKPRKLTNHMIAGPDYSVIHPALFPHNPKAAEMATIQDWLLFDYKAGWGTDDFENHVPPGYTFPPRWASVDDRYDAREVINEQLRMLGEYRRQGTQVLQAGYQLGDIVTRRAGPSGIDFKVEVRNATRGHNVPTGFIAERAVFLRVKVTDSMGRLVFESGDLDPNGDVRDNHSLYVHNGELAQDDQLFSLQSQFLTTMVRGGEREQVLAINYSPDPLAFIRPSTSSTILTGRPPGARIHRVGIPPEESRWARYRVDKNQLKTSTPPYKVNVKLIAGMVPVNLVDAIKGVGFDYGMSARSVADKVVEGHRVLWEREMILDENNP